MPQPEVAWTDQDWRSVWKVNADFSAWKPKAKTGHIWRDSFQVSIVFKENLREELVAEDRAIKELVFKELWEYPNSSLCGQPCINLLSGKKIDRQITKVPLGLEGL